MKLFIFLSLIGLTYADTVVKFNYYDSETRDPITSLPIKEQKLVAHLLDEGVDNIKFVHNKVAQKHLGKLHRAYSTMADVNCRTIFTIDAENNAIALTRCSPV